MASNHKYGATPDHILLKGKRIKQPFGQYIHGPPYFRPPPTGDIGKSKPGIDKPHAKGTPPRLAPAKVSASTPDSQFQPARTRAQIFQAQYQAPLHRLTEYFEQNPHNDPDPFSNPHFLEEVSASELAARRRVGVRDSPEHMLNRFLQYVCDKDASHLSEKWASYLEMHDGFYRLYRWMQKADWVPKLAPLANDYRENKLEWQRVLRERFQDHPLWLGEQCEYLKLLKTQYERHESDDRATEESRMTNLKELIATAEPEDYFEHLCHKLHADEAASTGFVFGVPNPDYADKMTTTFTEADTRHEYKSLVGFARLKFGSRWRTTLLEHDVSHATSRKPLRCVQSRHHKKLSLDDLIVTEFARSATNDFAKRISKLYAEETKSVRDANRELTSVLGKLNKPANTRISNLKFLEARLMEWLTQLQINGQFKVDYRGEKLPDYGHEHAKKMSFFEPFYDMLFSYNVNSADLEKRMWPSELRYRVHQQFGHHWVAAAKPQGATGQNFGPSNAAGQSAGLGPGKGKGKGKAKR